MDDSSFTLDRGTFLQGIASVAVADMRADERDGRADFDFFHGQWSVQHRRLRVLPTGERTWDEFGGRVVVWPIVGGLANIDDNVLEAPAGTYRAATLRAFDPQTRTWRIRWLDGRYLAAALDPPLVGAFHEGVGTFFATDEVDGRPVPERITRFIWSGI